MPRKPLSGFTLAEIIVSVALTAIMLLFIYGVLIMIIRFWNMGNSMIDVQRSASIAAVKLSSQLKNSSISTVTVLNEEVGDASLLLSFASPIGNGGDLSIDAVTGRPLWQKYIVYALNDDADRPSYYKLTGYDYNPGLPITGPLSQDSLRGFYTSLASSGTSFVLAEKVLSMDVISNPPGHTVSIRITTQEEVRDIYGKTQLQRIDVRTTVSLRN